MKKLMNLVRGEEAASMVEYGLLVALIAVALITAITTLSGGIGTLFGRANTGLGNPT